MMIIIGYIISGLIIESWLIYNRVYKVGEYSFTIVDCFIAVAVVEFWPIILILKSLKIRFDIELFRIVINNNEDKT